MMRAEDQSGFTLLELLVVITILGLTVVALTNGVRFAGRAWETQERQSARHGDLHSVQNVLRQIITSASDFTGDGVSLRFVGTMPDALRRGGLYDIELRTIGDRLVLASKPHFRGPMAGATVNTADLTEGVTAFDLAYYIPPGGWQRTARDRNRPPALVRIAVQLADGRTWSPLVVAPMVEARSAVMK
jgi:prepilin-type N-terminal cleavage/methylation domain-containing protein